MTHPNIPHIYTFEEVLADGADTSTHHTLLGNGFSMAWNANTFGYGGLRQRADFSKLSVDPNPLFDAIGAPDFEKLIATLRAAAQLLANYPGVSPVLTNQLIQDADALRDILAQVLAASHPERPSELTAGQLHSARVFLSNFKRIYSLNYDLLLYWIIMQDCALEIPKDDGFRTSEDQDDFVTWHPYVSSTSQTVYYLHGALHIFEHAYELEKYTWKHKNVRLIEQIRAALSNEQYPLFVSEGSWQDKLTRVNHSHYLSKGMRSIAEIGGSLFCFGVSFSDNDRHISSAVSSSNVKKLYISVFGDPESPANQHIYQAGSSIAAQRSAKKPLDVKYFSAESAKVWDRFLDPDTGADIYVPQE